MSFYTSGKGGNVMLTSYMKQRILDWPRPWLARQRYPTCRQQYTELWVSLRARVHSSCPSPEVLSWHSSQAHDCLQIKGVISDLVMLWSLTIAALEQGRELALPAAWWGQVQIRHWVLMMWRKVGCVCDFPHRTIPRYVYTHMNAQRTRTH